MRPADIAAAMMADLGLARRDYVSAPLANERCREDVGLQGKIQAGNARRARAISNGPEDRQHLEILRKWNSSLLPEKSE